MRARRNTIVLLLAAVGVSAASILLGVVYAGWGEYRNGLLVEVPSMFLGGVLLVLFLDWLDERRTREQWADYLQLSRRRIRRVLTLLDDRTGMAVRVHLGRGPAVSDYQHRNRDPADDLRYIAVRVNDASYSWKSQLNVRLKRDDLPDPPPEAQMGRRPASIAESLAFSADSCLAPLAEELRVTQIPSEGVVIGEALLRLLEANETLQDEASWIPLDDDGGPGTAEALVELFGRAAELADLLRSDELAAQSDVAPSTQGSWFNRKVCGACRALRLR